MTALEGASYTLSTWGDQGITPLRLQKLLYYLKVWGLVSGQDLIVDEFLKWKYGPVNESVFQEYKKYGSNVIPKVTVPAVEFTGLAKKTADFIIENYIQFSALTLSSMTHSEDPWKNTPLNHKISESSMKKYYSKLHFAKNFPVSDDKPYYPVPTDAYHAFIFDMPPEVAEMYKFNSYSDYKKITQEESEKSNNLLNQL